MTARDPAVGDILAMFAVDYRQGPAALGIYCVRYPQHRDELLAFAHELDLQDSLAGELPIDAGLEAAITDILASTESIDPFAALDPPAYNVLRADLSVPSLVLNAFRDRSIKAGTVPVAFLERLADGLHVSLRDLARFLAAPPRLDQATQHKSQQTPRPVADKIDFATLLDEAGVSPARSAELLIDDD